MRQENAVWIPMSFPVRQSDGVVWHKGKSCEKWKNNQLEGVKKDVVYKAGIMGVRNKGSGEYG